MFSRVIATSSTSNAYRFFCLRLVNFIFSNYTSKPFFVQANCMGEMYYNSRDAHSQNRTFRAPLLRNVHCYNSRDAHLQNRTFRAPLLRNVHCYNSRDAQYLRLSPKVNGFHEPDTWSRSFKVMYNKKEHKRNLRSLVRRRNHYA